MPRKIIALVSCVSKKADTPCPARELYTSQWFKLAQAYAEKTFDEYYILSAEYGLLMPSRVVSPYERSLNNMPKHARAFWAGVVFCQLSQISKGGSDMVFFAGHHYREFLLPNLENIGVHCHVPMRGLGIGQQLKWLKEHQ